MPQTDWFIPVVMGGVFVIIGIAVLFWGKKEGKSYYNSLSTHTDVREFLEHSPPRPEPTSLNIGGWLAIAIGLAMLALAAAFWLWG